MLADFIQFAATLLLSEPFPLPEGNNIAPYGYRFQFIVSKSTSVT